MSVREDRNRNPIQSRRAPGRASIGGGVFQDVRFGARLLARSPGFALTVVTMLALGIGASTACFSLIDALMLRALPVEAPQQLYAIGDRGGGGTMVADSARERDDVLFSHPLYVEMRDQNEVFSGLAALCSYANTVYLRAEGGAIPEALETTEARLVSGNFFSVLGVRAALGRRTCRRAEPRAWTRWWPYVTSESVARSRPRPLPAREVVEGSRRFEVAHPRQDILSLA